ncbi:DEAD/DEAH box helicase family protein [Clostridium perfringens]|nr:DEAD/DEAH box helicase family protein [Clostridium perfringens]MDM0465395.1 DEAD/DEAH box helicase family protein [Clostridium perfringens]
MNLIVAPAGSGKTYWIFNTLVKDYDLSKVIYLCDTSNLKEAVAKDKEYMDKCHIVDERFEGFGSKVTIMTYSKFGHMLIKNKNVFDGVQLIICDEAHNLFKYRNRFDSKKQKNGEVDTKFVYTRTIDYLFDNVEKGIDIVFTTATHRKVFEGVWVSEDTKIVEDGKLIEEKMFRIETKRFKMLNILDMNKYQNIKRLKEDFTYYVSNYKNIIYHLKAYNGFRFGKKALIYTDRIDTVKDFELICRNIGLKAIGIWYTNNQEKKMDDNQLEVRKSIIENGVIPKEIDVLIINSSYETGINIKNDNIELVVVNNLIKIYSQRDITVMELYCLYQEI